MEKALSRLDRVRNLKFDSVCEICHLGTTFKSTTKQSKLGQCCIRGDQRLHMVRKKHKNSIRDARIPQPGEIVFNAIRYRSSETVHRLGTFRALHVKIKY